MSTPPSRPRIYHITHVDNLPSIVADGGLLSDRTMATRGGPPVPIGMPSVKSDRLGKTLACHPSDFVGDYVPFNFSARSVMLYVVYRGDHPSLAYHGGQDEIVHLECDLHTVIDWASSGGIHWAITDRNARTEYGRSFATEDGLDELDWEAIANSDFRDPEVKDLKQAEFLIYGQLPWELVDTIAAKSMDIVARAKAALGGASHVPDVVVEASWYY